MSPFVGVYPDVDKVQRGFQFHASLLGTRLTGGFHAQPVENKMERCGWLVPAPDRSRVAQVGSVPHTAESGIG